MDNSPQQKGGLTQATAGRNPKDLMLSDRSQTKAHVDEMSRGQVIEAELQMGLVIRVRGRGVVSHCLMGMGFPLGVMEMSWNYVEAMAVQG